MNSVMSPKRGEDLYRSMQGLALVISKVAPNSPFLSNVEGFAASCARTFDLSKYSPVLEKFKEHGATSRSRGYSSSSSASRSAVAPRPLGDGRTAPQGSHSNVSFGQTHPLHAQQQVDSMTTRAAHTLARSSVTPASRLSMGQMASPDLRAPSAMVHAPLNRRNYSANQPAPGYGAEFSILPRSCSAVSGCSTRTESRVGSRSLSSATIEADAHAEAATATKTTAKKVVPVVARRKFREREVPASRVGRAMGFAGLGAGMVWGAATEVVSRAISPQSDKPQGNAFLSEANAERLANALCRMRGAALKIGQMLSIQDEDLLPPQVAVALERVRQSADVMPRHQLEAVLAAELGSDWESRLSHFDWEPSAAASIGQVHKATLKDGRTVAFKVQYPGVADSIESDVDNLMRLMTVANVFPRGLYLEEAAAVAKKELAIECDYSNEARCQTRFREYMLAEDPEFSRNFVVPAVVQELSSRRVLCSEWVPGVAVDSVKDMDAEVRDRVGKLLLELTLKELFEWRFMQTDPNWGNFLFDEATGKLSLIDFGAARDFPKPFVDDYLRMVMACSEENFPEVIRCSTKLGFLTGEESQVMLDAHCRAGATVGVPFGHDGMYDFGSHNGLTRRVSELGSTMLKHRLTPPPEDAYSLHRRLSGAFLVNIKLKAKVPCKEVFRQVYDNHKF